MTSTKHLSSRDRAGARRIVKAWKMDKNAKWGGDERFQCPSRDPLDHARFFREVWLIASARERRRMNQVALDYLDLTDEVMDQ